MTFDSPTSSGQSRTFRGLKDWICGALLMTFSVSHLVMLLYYDPTKSLPNPVFTFLANQTVFAAAAFVEFLVACICIGYRKTALATVAVWLFVVLMLWYRLFLHLAGGDQPCNCLGAIGHMLRVDYHTEQALPLVILGILVALNLPLSMSPKRLSAMVVLFALMLSPMIAGETPYAILGKVEARAFNPLNGEEYEHMRADSAFEAIFDGEKYSIQLKSLMPAGWWQSFDFDGAKSILQAPADGSFRDGTPPKSGRILALVSSRPVPELESFDRLGLCALWAVYCLPHHVASGKLGPREEIPLLWDAPRTRVLAHGYSWIASPAASNSFMIERKVIRTKKLDRSNDEEFFRLGMDFENTVAIRNAISVAMSKRREEVEGFEIAEIKVHGWAERPQIAKEAELSIKLGDSPRYRHVWRRYRIKVEVVADAPQLGNLTRSGDAEVHDYRFAARRDALIYRYAKYELSSADNLPALSDDKLNALREAELTPESRVYCTREFWLWVSLVAILGGFASAFCVAAKKHKQ